MERIVKGLMSVRATRKSLRWGYGSGIITGRSVQFGDVECVMCCRTGCDTSADE